VAADLRIGIANKWGAPGEQFKEQCTERIDIGANIKRLTPKLLRRHILGRPNQVAGLLPCRLERKPKVGKHRRPIGAQQHIGWLQIAVDQPLLMGIGQRLKQRQQQLDRFCERYWPLCDPIGQAARQQLHDHKWLALELIDIEDIDDAWVREQCDGLRLVEELTARVGIVAQHQLDRHGALQQRVRRLIDGAGAALPNQPAECVFS
jgi:hypothetical protein